MCLGPMRVCRPKFKQQPLCPQASRTTAFGNNIYQKNAVFILINTAGLVNSESLLALTYLGLAAECEKSPGKL